MFALVSFCWFVLQWYKNSVEKKWNGIFGRGNSKKEAQKKEVVCFF